MGFGQDGTQVGPASVAERDARRERPGLQRRARSAALIGSGRSVTFGAFDPDLGAVGGGSHNPRGDVTEIVGVGVLPAHRRRGIAGHLTWALAADAAEAGVRTLFMSAGSDDVARVYEGVGFQRVGTACISAEWSVRAGAAPAAAQPLDVRRHLVGGRAVEPDDADRRGAGPPDVPPDRGVRRPGDANRPLRRSVKVNRARIPW